MNKKGYVYIVTNKRNGTLYIGVTSNLVQRIWQHKEGITDGFTKKYDCKILVWYKEFDAIETAIQREKQMKIWKRLWKLREIEDMNPDWNDLFEGLI